ncbi:GGDEF domain-containing protein [Glaciecola sp. KUL10]|uniref:GGDEF domain-containing protein n=1 Tax=Glaciecola sp. (strain KUL10) TaxID=2161813 RepID=UPI000D787A15|nr:GGDEF domain-containing protein [Glaciecola sp. KUL10]GBL06090.1 diguanylate cyclase (GGDEF) domain-containing protein [Glaciecola sp. KUL10]
MLAEFATTLWQHDFLRKAPQSVAAEDQTDYFTILWVAIIALPIHLAFSLLFWLTGLNSLAIYNLASLVIWLSVIKLARRARYSEAIMLGGAEVIIHASLATVFLGTEFGFQLYLWPTACIIAIHTQTKILGAILFALTTFVIFILLELNFSQGRVDTVFMGYELYFYSFCLISGGIPFIIGMMRMKSVYMRQRQRVEQFANIDQLTGLFSRRYFYNFLHFQKFQSKKENKHFAIAIGDIDHFKKLNDERGHEAGDQVLKEVSTIIKETIGNTHKACRWGGEEFLIFFDDLELKDCEELLNSLKDKIKAQVMIENNGTVTISFGVVTTHKEFALDQLVFQADALLYEAKAAGRNRVHVAQYSGNKTQ